MECWNLCDPAALSYQTHGLISLTLVITKRKKRKGKTRMSFTLTISVKAVVNDGLTIIILKP